MISLVCDLIAKGSKRLWKKINLSNNLITREGREGKEGKGTEGMGWNMEWKEKGNGRRMEGEKKRTFFAAARRTRGMNKATNKMKSEEVESKNPAEMVAKTAEEIPKYALDNPATCPVTSDGNI